MKKIYKYLLILGIIAIIVLAAVFLNLNGRNGGGNAETDSIADTEQAVSTAESVPADESGSEQVTEYVVELDEDEAFEIN